MPPASIATLCDRLADAFERRGVEVRDNLQPGLDRDAILAAVRPLGIELPEEVIALYAWRDGHVDPYDGPRLDFRDNSLLTLEQAIDEYRRLNAPDCLEQVRELNGIDLAQSFPVAGFDGSVYVVAWGEHPWAEATPRPVVQLFEDVDRYFLSVPHMLETSHAWVSHPAWDEGSLDAEVEMEIWQRLNPGVLDGGGDED
jgi:hypothetical protein